MLAIQVTSCSQYRGVLGIDYGVTIMFIGKLVILVVGGFESLCQIVDGVYRIPLSSSFMERKVVFT